MPTTNHTVSLTINGVNYTSLLKRESLYIRHSIGNDNGVADFKIKESNYRPQGWDQVSIVIDGTTVFGGFIFQYNGEVLGAGPTRETQWQVQAKDWSILLDRVIVEREYKERGDQYILSDMFLLYLASEGFDISTHVTSLNPDLDIAFQRITLREAMNQLAARVGAQWFITPDKKLVWKSAAGFPASTVNIDTVSPNGTTTVDVAYGSLRRQIDESSIINKVVVVGGNNASGPRTSETFQGDGITDTFGPLSADIQSVWMVDYWMDGQRYIRYTSNIGYEPGDKLFADGGSYEIICNPETRTVRIQHQNGDVPDNGTDVVIDYYTLVPVTTTSQHTGSQAYYGRTFTQHVYNQELTSPSAAQEYGDAIIAKNAFGRETITFDVFEYGLLPGTRIMINAPSLGLGTVVSEADLALEYNITDGNYLSVRDGILWENNDDGSIENYGGTVRYVVQEVQYQPVLTASGNYMMVAKVSVGDWAHTLIDALAQMGAASTAGGGGGALSAGAGRTSNIRSAGRLSNLTNDLGEVVAGHALFTDGGTAAFSWSNYAGHTGAIVGLEDNGTVPYGALYIIDQGSIKAKLGRMFDMPTVGTVTPTGWGLWTNNGYFTGIVAASQMIGGTIQGGQITGGTITGGRISGGTVSGALVTGGTVSGNLITGGTLQATLGTIAGFTIANNMLWSNGGTIATGSIINSSNPGVYLTNTGLYGFGTLGLTFKIPTNPAEAPWFSSGTINNVVYEVYESAVMRTTENVFSDGGIQIDNSGIFGVNPLTGAGALLMENSDLLLSEDNREIVFAGLSFMLDSTTGKFFAEEAWIQGTVHAKAGVFEGTVFASAGQFSGTVSAAQITGGTISGALLTGNTITGITVSASDITTGTLSGVTISGNTISGNAITGGTITGVTVTANNISGGTVTGSRITGGTITGVTVTANNISGGTVSGASVTGNNISGGTITGSRVTGGTITGGIITGQTITGNAISGGTVSGGLISGGTVSGAVISGGTVTGAVITASNGTVRIGEGYGIQFYGVLNGGPDDELKWRINGTAVASISASRADGGGGSDTNVLRLSVANDGSSTGRIQIYSGDNQVYIQPSQIYTQVGTGGSARWTRVNFAGVEARGDLYPAANTWNLGRNDNDNIWAGIYLKDATTGATRYFRINNGTVLIT